MEFPSSRRTSPLLPIFCFLKILSGVQMLTTFYLTKNDRRWVICISLKTITIASSAKARC